MYLSCVHVSCSVQVHSVNDGLALAYQNLCAQITRFACFTSSFFFIIILLQYAAASLRNHRFSIIIIVWVISSSMLMESHSFCMHRCILLVNLNHLVCVCVCAYVFVLLSVSKCVCTLYSEFDEAFNRFFCCCCCCYSTTLSRLHSSNETWTNMVCCDFSFERG